MGVTASPLTWVVRALWLTLPLTCGDLVATTLDGRSGPVRGVAIGLAWAVWAAGLLASLVTQPSALTVLRTLAPLPLVASAVCAVESTPSAIGWLGLATSALVVVVAGSAVVGADFVDGASYGDERRFALRPPAVLLAGPIPLTWALTTLPLPLGALLLAAGRWFAGAVLVVAGAATAWWGFRVLHRLARRCVVFVPAGLTLVDELAAVDPVLFRRRDLHRIGPAPADTGALDLSAAASGLILQLDVDPPVTVAPTVGRGRDTESLEVRSVLIAPSRPGALLAHADERRLAVQRG